MVKYASDVIKIMRDATGRVDRTDPQFTDTVMLGYINDYLTLEKSTELRLKEKRTFWEFNIDPTTLNPLPVNLQQPFEAPEGVQFTTIGPFCTADGFEVFWYEDIYTFFGQWPETQLYQPQRPTYVLYYNNELLFRGPPDKQYLIKIEAYQVDLPLAANDPLENDYIWRYIAYGAARDLLNDYREFETVANNAAAFNDYRSKVYARTYQQQMNQRATPRY